MIASADAESYRRSLAVQHAHENVDKALVINVKPLVAHPKDNIQAVGESAREGSAAAKPVLAVMMAEEEFYAEVKNRHDLPPVYRFPESAARALLMLHRYAAWRRRPADEVRPRFEVDDTAVERLLDGADSADGYLTPADTFRVLEHYGIPLAAWRMTADVDEAARAAGELGYPVAIKGVARGLVHKSELGAVAVGLETEAELRAAVARMESSVAAAGLGLDGFLVQEMAASGHETIFGISTDPRFGPLLMFGLGGKYVEVFNDVRFGVTPLSPSEALDMVRSIRGFKLLAGVRGEEAADLDVLVEVLLRLSLLAERHPQTAELDLNPFLAAPRGERALAVDARLRVRR
jgi:acetyltransferase